MNHIGMKAPHMQLALIAILVFLETFLAAPSFAAEKPGNNILKQNNLKTEGPINIASDRMEANQADKTILFEGHVVVRQADLTISGARLKVYGITEKKASEPNTAKKTPESNGDKKGSDPNMVDQIDRIEIEGDVKVVQKDKAATAEKAVYYHRDQKIVLFGNPTVSQGEDKIKGRLITLYIADGKSVVEGGETTPVQAILHPKKD